jgi:hypothetical protein
VRATAGGDVGGPGEDLGEQVQQGVSGVPAPSMTASAVAAACVMPKVAAMCRSSSPSRASPVRHKDA